MSDRKGKGKGRASDDDSEIASPSNNSDSSMLSRIGASASGLARSALTTPSSNEMDNHAASILASTGKGQTSVYGVSGSSAWIESSKRSLHNVSQARGAPGLKLGHKEEHIRQSEDEFAAFLEGIDPTTLSGPSGSIGVDPYESIGSTWGEAWARAQTISDEKPAAAVLVSKSVAQQEARDGQEVLDLLSAPGGIVAELDAPEEEDENYDWGLTPYQISEIRAMTRHLGPPVPHASISIDDPLNLVPNLDVQGRAQWIEQWEGVLTRYSDEVWGGLLPLVREARQEIDEVQAMDPISVTEKPAALRRLEAILGHFQSR